jgi:hypothetical protein
VGHLIEHIAIERAQKRQYRALGVRRTSRIPWYAGDPFRRQSIHGGRGRRAGRRSETAIVKKELRRNTSPQFTIT